MALIVGMLARKIGTMMNDSHNQEAPQQQQQQHWQGPYNSNHHHQHNMQYGPQTHYDQSPMHGGYYYHNSPPMAQRPAVGHRAERHYRRAERTMMRAEHKAEKQCRRAERDIRRAERRGEIIPDVSAVHRPTNGPAYPAVNQGYEMRDMGCYQQQQPQPQHYPQSAPSFGSRDIGHAGASSRQTEDVPPPAYEEVEKKQ